MDQYYFGRVAYEAYAKQQLGPSAKFTPFDTLVKSTQDAWNAAAKAVLTDANADNDTQIENMIKDVGANVGDLVPEVKPE